MIFGEDINEALNTLRQGGIILYPTDTIWGLGCDPANESAVRKLFKIKARNKSKSLIILVTSLSMIERYTENTPGIAYELAAISDSPLTVVYPKGKNLAGGVCADDGSIAIRICNDEFCNLLINRFRKPVVSSSANFSGHSTPANFGEIEKSLIDKVDYVVKYRRNDRSKGVASPVIKVNGNGTIEIIRK